MMVGEHSGPAMVESEFDSLASHPAGFSKRSLQARCSIVGGDGQICIGGPAHRHHSSSASNEGPQ